MTLPRNNFIKVLKRESFTPIPLYCTGYPEREFIDKYTESYKIETNNTEYVLNLKNYDIIKQMGFDAISLWDFRRGKGGYAIDDQRRVDGWGRIYKKDWYSWEGVFREEKILEEWDFLKIPSKEKLKNLNEFLAKEKQDLTYIISLPGLFEKTWQSMGFYYFAKCLKKNIKFIETIVSFFSDYLRKLIKELQNTGVENFLIADDYGYKNRTFISTEIWLHLFFEKYKNIINIIKKKRQNVIIHSDGYISEMIKIFIDLGFDGVQSLEPNSGVDIFSLFKKYKDQICFIGNLDISLLSFGTPEQVRNYVIKLIKKSKKFNCFLAISPTQQINQHCTPKNINAMIETTKIFK
ncbi:MAG: uroporphyrinogen decarboxylase family protein [Candidatus Odinarchaeota archaeon]